MSACRRSRCDDVSHVIMLLSAVTWDVWWNCHTD